MWVSTDRESSSAQALTEGNADDATTALRLIEAVEGDLASVTGDAAYDTIAFYDAAGARSANVVVPPTKASSVSRRGRRSIARDRTIRMVEGTRAATVETGGGLPAASSGRERLLPVQIDHRGWPSSPHSRRASGRGTPRAQPPESDDRPGQARVVRHRSVKRLWSGSGRANSDSCTNAVSGRRVRAGFQVPPDEPEHGPDVARKARKNHMEMNSIYILLIINSL